MVFWSKVTFRDYKYKKKGKKKNLNPQKKNDQLFFTQKKQAKN